jgi:hypothetical protein
MTKKEERTIEIQQACAEVIKVHNVREKEIRTICENYKADPNYIKRIVFGNQSI